MRGFVREAVYPFENTWQMVKRHGVSRLRVAWESAGEAVTRESLEQEIALLRISAELQASILEENRRLREAVGFAQKSMNNLVPAPVLSRGGALGAARTIRIGKGSAHGLKRGSVVVVPDGVVGRVDEVSLHTADVLLITSPDCRVAAEVAAVGDGEQEAPRVRGIVFGEGGRMADGRLSMFWAADPLRVKYLKRDAVIAPRTEVFTSGLGGVFPAGLRLGWVLESFVGSSELYREATLLPAVDFQSLEVVFVLGD